jgi:hypothetical protein
MTEIQVTPEQIEFLTRLDREVTMAQEVYKTAIVAIVRGANIIEFDSVQLKEDKLIVSSNGT